MLAIIFLCFVLFYLLPVSLVFIIGRVNDDFELTSSGKLFALIPLVAWIDLVVILVEWIKDKFDDFDLDDVLDTLGDWKDGFLEFITGPIRYYREKKREREERANKLRIALAERERKIKNGIIRISPIDPYGEEDWTSEDIIPKPKREPQRGVPFGFQFDD